MTNEKQLIPNVNATEFGVGLPMTSDTLSNAISVLEQLKISYEEKRLKFPQYNEEPLFIIGPRQPYGAIRVLGWYLIVPNEYVIEGDNR